MESGYFSGIAHPDRSYRYLKPGEQADIGIVKELINAAAEYHIPLEKNISSMEASGDILEILYRRLSGRFRCPFCIGDDEKISLLNFF